MFVYSILLTPPLAIISLNPTQTYPPPKKRASVPGGTGASNFYTKTTSYNIVTNQPPATSAERFCNPTPNVQDGICRNFRAKNRPASNASHKILNIVSLPHGGKSQNCPVPQA